MGISIETTEKGVFVKQAIPGTPAEKAGLQKGDIVKKIDSSSVQTVEELIQLVQSKGVGNTVNVEFIRENSLKKLSLKLEARPDSTELIKKQLIGKKVPKFTLEQVTSKTNFTEKDLNNQITVIEFWATWCGPCRATHQRLSQFSKENSNIQVIAISSEKMELIKEYLNSTKHNFTTLRDSTESLHLFFMVTAIPYSAVIDQNGVIRSIALGGGFYLEENLKLAVELSKKKESFN
jgi:thiol-disulfide isomerase/thioredoxin